MSESWRNWSNVSMVQETHLAFKNLILLFAYDVYIVQTLI